MSELGSNTLNLGRLFILVITLCLLVGCNLYMKKSFSEALVETLLAGNGVAGHDKTFDEMKVHFEGYIKQMPHDFIADSGATVWDIVLGANGMPDYDSKEDVELERRKVELTIVLLKHGFDINQQNDRGCTIIQSLTAFEDYKNILYLIKNGADVNIYNHLALASFCKTSAFNMLKKNHENNVVANDIYKVLQKTIRAK